MDVSQLNTAIRDMGMPLRMQRLPINERGYPVPYFVAMLDGKWDFRAIDPEKMRHCVTKRLCWLCGDKLGQYMAFTIGPMCSVNRINSEPPSHLACAQYAVRACPFLNNPRMRRNENDVPEGTVPGMHIAHNPGATAIWITKGYKTKRVSNGVLFELGEPVNVMWYAQGRPASRDEVVEAMNKGLPALEKLAYGSKAKEALKAAAARMTQWLPKEDSDHAGPV
jgi:hypothetical protein